MHLIGLGAIMGVAFAATPGALTAEAIRRGLAGPAFRSTLLVGLGSLIGDAVYAALALAGLAVLIDRPFVRLGLGILGTAVLLWLAWETLRQARGGWRRPEATAGRGGSAFLSGAAISLTNPFAVVFWVSLGGTVASLIGPDAGIEALALFFASFLAGSLLWAFVLAGLVHWGRRTLGHVLGRWVTVACGLALAGFAVYLGFQVLGDTLL